MRGEHISTVPTWPNGRRGEPVYELHGLCRCDARVEVTAIGECQKCHRLVLNPAARRQVTA